VQRHDVRGQVGHRHVRRRLLLALRGDALTRGDAARGRDGFGTGVLLPILLG
jgi:hypothetical protein